MTPAMAYGLPEHAGAHSLRTRLLAIYVPVLVVLSVGLFAVLEWRAHSQAMAALEQRMETFVATSAPVLATPMWAFDDSLVRSLVSVMGQHPDLAAIRVRDPSGRVVAAAGAMAALESSGGRFVREAPLIKQEIDGATTVGTMALAFDESRVLAALWRSLATDAIIIAVVMGALVVLVSVTTGRLIFRPLSHLHRALTAEVAPGEVRHVSEPASDELGEVIAAFNALENRRAALEESRTRLITMGIQLGAERNPRRLVESVLQVASDLCHADGGTVYLLDRDAGQLEFAIVLNRSLKIHLGGEGGPDIPFAPLPLHGPDGRPNSANVAVHAALTGQVVNVPDVYDNTAFDFAGPRAFDATHGYRTTSLLAVPLSDRQGEIIGVLQLINASDAERTTVKAFDGPTESIARALAAQAGVALENQLLLEAQRRLLDSFIELMAGAIDAKSPYTGGHCSRVPDLTRMLTEAACADTDRFQAFDLTEDEWYELHIASWLHDCGKVTSPEYVVDKATKLETIYNRIHEIRTRFEVLWRDARIEELLAVQDGADPAAAAETRERTQADLVEDFAFVATCNVGGEFLDDASIERLRRIGARPWTRHFDDRLGLSVAEAERLRAFPAPPLPVEDRLLSDKPEQVVPWPDNTPPIRENDPRGFTLLAPRHQFNLGELYNLSIRRGTLTEEERFKVNDHIVQTIIMLESLPLPPHLRRVPEYAGGHHEKMDGTGYPRGLKAGTMSIPARIMAIADVFEALTAADRPYKKPKTVSEALRIMSFMRNDNHIDPDLFDLFLRSGVWRDYAHRFLDPEQIDAVDIAAYQRAS
ncbi:HD family phosphohydrolase [Roseospira navarrensis]|uniref:GAF domain-containing protein n=1 Tax=Roseospira navarrensis TaxID=140058 RepID=A0A7X1ZDP6_9PROT|nr:HD family phosphohydrolase [Roseospira navarrensis]MQX36650.1 GAF domain-containing protein [Roseospira navarrensis]